MRLIFCFKKSDKDLLTVDSIQWADGFLFVYSILDKASFEYIQRFRRHVLEIKNIGVNAKDQQACTIPCVLLANKADMVHLRQVATQEGNGRELSRVIYFGKKKDPRFFNSIV